MSRVIRWTESTTLTQSPTAELWREFDWSDFLVSPAIVANSEWEVEPLGDDNSLEIDDEVIVSGGQKTGLTIKSNGAEVGSTFRLSNSIETNETPVQKQTMSVLVRIVAA